MQKDYIGFIHSQDSEQFQKYNLSKVAQTIRAEKADLSVVEVTKLKKRVDTNAENEIRLVSKQASKQASKRNGLAIFMVKIVAPVLPEMFGINRVYHQQLQQCKVVEGSLI